jgi:hypothetical protein
MKLTHTIALFTLFAAAALGLRAATAGASKVLPPEDPAIKKKIVPIITVGSSLNVGAAQVAGAEKDVNRCKAVAQLETDYKDVARIKILVPIQSEKVIKNIDRVPGVSVTAVADYAIKR